MGFPKTLLLLTLLLPSLAAGAAAPQHPDTLASNAGAEVPAPLDRSDRSDKSVKSDRTRAGGQSNKASAGGKLDQSAPRITSPALPWLGGVVLRAEGGYLPALFLEDAFTVARDLGYWGGGVQVFGPLGGAWGWTLSGGLFRLWENDGFWQAKDSPRDGAFYARPRSNFLTVTGGVTWQHRLHRNLGLVLAADFGAAFFTGDIKTSEIIPGCTGPLDQCGHWETQGTEGLGLPGAWLPLLGVQGGLRVPLPAGLFVQGNLGWRGLPFSSLELGWSRPSANRP